jgi:hypothetical protein
MLDKVDLDTPGLKVRLPDGRMGEMVCINLRHLMCGKVEKVDIKINDAVGGASWRYFRVSELERLDA